MLLPSDDIVVVSACAHGIDSEKSAEEIHDSPDELNERDWAVADMSAENHFAAIVADKVPVNIGMIIFIDLKLLMSRNIFIAFGAEKSIGVADIGTGCINRFNIINGMNASVIGSMDKI